MSNLFNTDLPGSIFLPNERVFQLAGYVLTLSGSGNWAFYHRQNYPFGVPTFKGSSATPQGAYIEGLEKIKWALESNIKTVNSYIEEAKK